jgi:uncharacterized protein HemX
VAAISATVTVWRFSGGHLVGPAHRLNPPEVDLSYSDFVSVLLTVLAVILAALAIGVGIVAFKTIRDIKDDARTIATDHATTVIGELTKAVPAQVDAVVITTVRQRLPEATQTSVREIVEEMAKNGTLGQLLDKAVMRMGALDPEAERELQPEFEDKPQTEDNDEKS